MQNQSSPSPSPSPSPPTQHPFFTTIPIPNPKDHKTTLYIILATYLFSLLFFLSSSSTSTSTSTSQIRPNPYLFPTSQTFSAPSPPSIAYLISGFASDSGRILRLLLATYHPKNQYLLHLDCTAPQSERDGLALSVQYTPIFKAAQNVNVVGKKKREQKERERKEREKNERGERNCRVKMSEEREMRVLKKKKIYAIQLQYHLTFEMVL
ncbi:beta-glucuronosyltransferase glcat14a [Quercus suber]|uniref:Beta-glucuronosyltransferase glcat14a n=1 Tax=Quercus suber TaxID=58331 RepID=A0AAW0MEZ0_QUESU